MSQCRLANYYRLTGRSTDFGQNCRSVVFFSTDFVKCTGFTTSWLFSTDLRKIPTASVTLVVRRYLSGRWPVNYLHHCAKPRCKALEPILPRKSANLFHQTSAISVRFSRFDIVPGSLFAQTMTISESRILPFFDVFSRPWSSYKGDEVKVEKRMATFLIFFVNLLWKPSVSAMFITQFISSFFVASRDYHCTLK